MTTTNDKKPRKERVIHTRVSDVLDAELRQKAQSLGVSVSNLVRNVLTNALGLVEDVIADSSQVARSARGEVAADEADVVAWQRVTLSRDATCARCGTPMARGSVAAMSVGAGSGRPLIRCPRILEDPDHDCTPTDP